MDKTSLLYWYPKIKDLEIPQPRTEWVLLSQKEFVTTMEGMPDSIIDRVDGLIKNKFQLPVFIRTDQSSAKHFWEKACYYDGSERLWRHLAEICMFNHCADIMGLYFTAMVVREYIEMDSKYTAFASMPVNPERRYFIKDGALLCHHHYWIKEAILRPSVENWEELSDEMNLETSAEIELLTTYTKQVAKIIDGFWSIDFCKAKDGRWILIDMAEGNKSWHPEDCKFALKEAGEQK